MWAHAVRWCLPFLHFERCRTLNGSLVGIATSWFPDGAEGFPRIFPEGEAPTSNKGIDTWLLMGFFQFFLSAYIIPQFIFYSPYLEEWIKMIASCSQIDRKAGATNQLHVGIMQQTTKVFESLRSPKGAAAKVQCYFRNSVHPLALWS